MAVIYVSSVDGSNTDNGSSWALAKATLAGALAIANPGDHIHVDSNHAEALTTTITLDTIAGSLDNPVVVLSVNRSNDTRQDGALVSIAAASNAAITIGNNNGDGAFVFQGITFRCASTANSTANDINICFAASGNKSVEFLDCGFSIRAASTTAQMFLGRGDTAGIDGTRIKFRNCSFELTNANVSPGFFLLGICDVEMINPTFSYAGANKPSTLFAWNGGLSGGDVVIRDGDISGYDTAGGSIFNLDGNSAQVAITLKNLKISGTPAITSGSFVSDSSYILLRNVDSGDTISSFEYRTRLGTLTENTSVYATNGAEFAGAGISWEIATTSVCNEANPFVVPAMFTWNGSTSAQTATVEIARNSATALTDRDIWLELAYADSASFPNYANDNDRNSAPFIGSPANQASSSNGWTGLGGTNTQQSLDVGFTAAAEGLVEARVYVGLASATLFVDPRLKVA